MGWCILYSPTDRGEKILRSVLKHTDPECGVWVPKVKTKIICGTEERVHETPLYENYLFVSRVTTKTRNKIETEMSRYAEPFLQILWDGNRPAELTPREYQVAKGFDSNYRIKRVIPGGPVRIRHPFVELVGQITDISEGTIEITLQLERPGNPVKRTIKVYYLLSSLYDNLVKELTPNLSFGGSM
jgi:hypothetical protein